MSASGEGLLEPYSNLPWRKLSSKREDQAGSEAGQHQWQKENQMERWLKEGGGLDCLKVEIKMNPGQKSRIR